MTVGTSEERIRCGLLVTSDQLSPDEITQRVGITPTRQRVKGQLRPGIPETSPVAIMRFHLWKWNTDESVQKSLDAQLETLWTSLGPRAEAFRQLVAPYAHICVDVLFEHYGNELSLGLTFKAHQVAEAAAFGASIAIDEYDYTESHQ